MPLSRDLRRRQARSRALLQAASRSALERSGERLEAAHQAHQAALDAVASQLPAALAAGMSVTEIAEVTGLSRQRIYELRDREQPEATDLERRLLISLAANGAQTLESLTHGIGENRASSVAQALDELLQRAAVRTAVTQYESGSANEWFIISSEGEAELEALVEPPGPDRRIAVYARVEADEVEALTGAAAEVLGGDRFAVLPPGTLRHQTWTELGLWVAAVDEQDAIARGRERIEALRRVAGLDERPAVITAVAPGETWPQA